MGPLWLANEKYVDVSGRARPTKTRQDAASSDDNAAAIAARFQVGHDSTSESVQTVLEGFDIGAVHVELFPLTSQQKRDLQVARTFVADASREDIQQLDVLGLFLDSVCWWNVDAGDFSLDFPAQPFAAIKSTLVKQRLSVTVDGALGRARECAKGMKDDSP